MDQKSAPSTSGGATACTATAASPNGPAPPTALPTVQVVVDVKGADVKDVNNEKDAKSAPIGKSDKILVDESFLTSPTSSDVAILLVDASGSTMQPFDVKDPDLKRTIFDRFERIAHTLPHRRFYILYWNSNQAGSTFGSVNNRGILKYEFLVTKEKLHQNFELTSKNITNSCLTFPDLAFANIGDWVKTVPMVYLLTDGEIGYSQIVKAELDSLKENLVNQIKSLISKNPDVQLNIVTVESKQRDFVGEKALEGLPGCDVFEVLSSNGLTQSLSSFTSYTPNCVTGYTHLKRVRAPPGFVAFGERYFSEKDTATFVAFIRQEIKKQKDEEALLTMLQQLSGTVSQLAKDKPVQRRNAFVNLFSGMFEKTEIDPVMAKFVLGNAVDLESAGSAALKANYRSQLKDLFKNADKMLLKDVRAATGVVDRFISFPLTNRNIIVVGPSDLVFNSVVIKGRMFNNAAANVDGKLVPVLPLKANYFQGKETTMSEQCIRQWVRSCCGQLFPFTDPMSETPIYQALGTLVQVFFSPAIDTEIVNCFKQVALTMLRKKRSNTIGVTELDVITEGKLPVPNNGDLAGLTAGLNLVAKRLGLTIQPYSLWFLMCLALDPMIAEKQKPHCDKDLQKDWPTLFNTAGQDVLNPQFVAGVKQLVKLPETSIATMYSVSFASILETQCLITMEELKSTGGFMFTTHGESKCRPRQMLSAKGLEMLLNNPASALCPVCYTALDRNSFVAVSQREIDPANIDYKSPFLVDSFTGFDAKMAVAPNKPNKDGVDVKSAPSASSVAKVGSSNGVLVVLKSTVGGGKTMLSLAMRSHCEVKGYPCLVLNTDQYAKNGMSMGAAVSQVSEDLRSFISENADKYHVVLSDTCGEKSNVHSIFGSDLSKYRLHTIYPHVENPAGNLTDFMAWSLHNVLSRGQCDQKSNYWLNPAGAGFATCVKVHRTKALAVFGNNAGKYLPKFKGKNTSTAEALEQLQAAATRFLTTVKQIDLACLDPK